MKRYHIKSVVSLVMITAICYSCEDFVAVDAPNNKMVREVVFQNDATAQSAMTGIYNQLFLSQIEYLKWPQRLLIRLM